MKYDDLLPLADQFRPIPMAEVPCHPDPDKQLAVVFPRDGVVIQQGLVALKLTDNMAEALACALNWGLERKRQGRG